MNANTMETKAARGIADRRRGRAERALATAQKELDQARAAEAQAKADHAQCMQNIAAAERDFAGIAAFEKPALFTRHDMHRTRLLAQADDKRKAVNLLNQRRQEAEGAVRDAASALAKADARADAAKVRERYVSRKAAQKRDAKLAEEAGDARRFAGVRW